MKEFILYLIKSGICLSIFLLIYQVFLRPNTFIKFNRFYLLLGLIASLILPAFKYTHNIVVQPAPVITVPPVIETMPQPLPATTIIAQQPEISSTISTPQVDLWSVIFAIYILGVTVLLVKKIISALRIRKLILNGAVTKHKSYKLVDSPDVVSPFSIFRYILMDTNKLSDTEKNIILKHEISHIKQFHRIDLLCSECALMLQWFNPLAWFYVRHMKENHEFLADDAVLQNGDVSLAAYRATLINQKFGCKVFSFSNTFNSNQLNRLTMMKKTKSSSIRKAAVLILIPAFGLFFKAFAETNYVTANVPDLQEEQAAVNETAIEASIANTGEKVSEEVTKKEEINTLPQDEELDFLYLIDGKIASVQDLKNLKKNQVKAAAGRFGQIILKKYFPEVKNKKGIHLLLTKTGDEDQDLLLNGKKISPRKLFAEITNRQDSYISTLSLLSMERQQNYVSFSDKKALYMVDGKEVSKEEYDNVPKESVKDYNQYFGKRAAAIIGNRDYHFVREKLTQKEVSVYQEYVESMKDNTESITPLFIVDGIAMDANSVDVDYESIKSITILKDKSETASYVKKYGEQASKGVVIIKTK